MGFSISITSANVWCSHFHIHKRPFVSFPVSNLNFVKLSPQLCLAAAKSQSQSQTGTGGPVKKRSPNKKKKKKSRTEQTSLQELSFNDVDVESLNDDENYAPTPLPKPPAGFVVDDTGRALLASDKRIATIVSSFFSSLFLCKCTLVSILILFPCEFYVGYTINICSCCGCLASVHLLLF